MKLETIKRKLAENKAKLAKQGYGRLLPSGTRFLSTCGVFKNGRGTFAIDLVNETGHSYDWWVMLKRIKGHLVLNTYRYSNNTSKHISKAHDILKSLGIKYLEIAAPRGLQDLDSAVHHAANQMGRDQVKLKYSRIKDPQSLGYAKELVANLSKLGLKVSKDILEAELLEAEKGREYRLIQLRNKVRVLVGTHDNSHKVGYHVIHEGYLNSYTKRTYVDEAKAKGFKRVFIHDKNEFHEKLVQVVNQGEQNE